MLTIYSIGDPWYLGKVMDAIAMISGHNAGFVGASAVAAIIGVFIVMFSTVIKMQGLNIHHLLICYVMYMGCFSTTTDVAIESVYGDKAVIQKDNVPYGPAVIGSIISTIGYGLTQKMEVAFSDTSPLTDKTDSSGGYANPLYLINNLANWAENGQMLKDIESTNAGKQFARNYMTYVKECTTKAIYLGPTYSGKTFDEVFNLPQNDDIAFSSDLYSTELIDPTTGRAQSYTCKDGINVIKEQFALAMSEYAGNTEKLVSLYQKIGKCTTTDECRAVISVSGSNNFDDIQDSLEKLRIGQYTAQSVMYAGLTNSLKKTGLAYGYAHYKDQQAASMLFQAVQQRNVQWASEANLFLNSFKPMMAFMEGFFYAISPFAAIIMLLGLFGLNIFFKYLILLIWIQLWMPIMAIANMFIITSARELLYNEGVAATAKAGTNLSSISTYMYEDLVAVTQDKIAVASIMLASTPVLALMLLTGSVYAFTSLTGKLSGGDHANEKLVAPDVVAPAAYMSMQSTAMADSTKFTYSGVAENSINLASGISAGTKSAYQNMSSIQNSLATNLQQGLLESGSLGNSHGLDGAVQHMKNGSRSEDFAKAVDMVMSESARNGVSLKADAAARVTMALSAATKGGIFGTSTAASFGLTGSEAVAFDKLFTGSNALSESKRASISSTIASGLTDSYGKQESYIKSGSLSNNVSEQAQNLVAASQTYDEFSQAQKRIESGVSVTDAELIANSRTMTGGLNAANKALGEAVQSLSSTEKDMYDSTYRDLSNQLRGKLGSDEEQRIQLRALNAVNSEKAALAAAKIANSAGLGGNMSGMDESYQRSQNNNIDKASGVNSATVDYIRNEANVRMNEAKESATYMTPDKKDFVGQTEVDSFENEANIEAKKQKEEMEAKRGREIADKNKQDYAKQNEVAMDFSKSTRGDRNYTSSVYEYGGFNKLNGNVKNGSYNDYYNANDSKAFAESYSDFTNNRGTGTQGIMMDMGHLAFSAGMAAKAEIQAADMALRTGGIDQTAHDSIVKEANAKFNAAMSDFKTATNAHAHTIGVGKTGYVTSKVNDLKNAVMKGDATIFTEKFNEITLKGDINKVF